MLSAFWSTFTGVFERTARHGHCVDVLMPSTFIHVSDKLLQLAATNCTHGGHRNTQASRKSLSNEWTLFWTLRCQRRAWIKSLLAISAQDANNKGSVITFDEFRKLSTTLFDPSLGIPFPEWVLKRFMAITLLFGALRTEQFNRFREGGLESVEFLTTNIDKDHRLSILSLFVAF